MLNIDVIYKEVRQYILEYSYKENYEEPFTLASGNRSPYYINLKQVLLHPKKLYEIAYLISQKIKQNHHQVSKGFSGLTMGADPLIYALSLNSTEWFSHEIYSMIVRKRSKTHGSKQGIEFVKGAVHKDDPIVLLDDVITTGNSTLQALYVLQENGFSNISSVYCVVDREEGGKINLEKEGLSLYPLYKLTDLKIQNLPATKYIKNSQDILSM